MSSIRSNYQELSDKIRFSYNYLTENLANNSTEKDKHMFISSKDGNYAASLLSPYGRAFIHVAYDSGEEEKAVPDGIIAKNHGLKFHISLPEVQENDTDQEKKQKEAQTEEAWDICLNILMSNKVASFKIIKKGLKMSDEQGQGGKVITIYTAWNPEKSFQDWCCILAEIDNALTSANIPVGFIPTGEKKAEGKFLDCTRIAYRYEKGWPQNNLYDSICIHNIAKDIINSTHSLSLNK